MFQRRGNHVSKEATVKICSHSEGKEYVPYVEHILSVNGEHIPPLTVEPIVIK